MFDYAESHTANRSPELPRGTTERVAEITYRLHDLRLVPPPRYGAARSSVCGSALRISVQGLLRGDADAESRLSRICALAAHGVPVSLWPEDFGAQSVAVESWQRFCEIIATALPGNAQPRPPGQALGICVHSHQIPLEAYCLIADSVLGDGPRFVFLDSLQMKSHCDVRIIERAEHNWTFLWRQRGRERPVMPVYGGMVRSACPLLADEVAALVLPGSGLHVPVDSAWLPVGVPLTRFATPDGRIEWDVLSSALRQAVDLAEEMLDLLAWSDPRQQADATMNRRLAFCLTGLGDLVSMRGQNPADLSVLNSTVEVARRIRQLLHECSSHIASDNGAMPALLQANPVSGWGAGAQRDSWQRHWKEAIRKSAVRHRNLLVISPYSVLPAASPCNAAYANLLPVIALADAWSFAAPARFPGWNVTEYRRFHRLARATIQGSHRASFVAAPV